MFLALMVTSLLATFGTADSLIRATSAGLVRGRADAQGTNAWLGIPYAAPPVGSLRWRAPKPPSPWSAVRAADSFGHSCVQMGGLQGPGRHEEPFGPSLAEAFGLPVGDEDCLTLNLWRPKSETTGLPIIVFLHGGANVAGYSADPLYDGARLASRLGAVVVTLNYRLGVFGWFGHPALEASSGPDDASGNFGLLDIIQALKFVRDNAASFGGDAKNVTLVGQSAGAVNAFALLVAPSARGLFHRVVALSGALIAVPRGSQYVYSASVASQVLIADGSAADSAGVARLLEMRGNAWLDEHLRGTPAAVLAEAASKVAGGGLPVADGTVLPLDPVAAVAAGRHLSVPLLIGSTAEEGKFFVQGVYRQGDAERFRTMLAADPDGQGAPRLVDLLQPEVGSAEAFNAAAEKAGAVVRHLIGSTRDLFGARLPVYAMEFAWAGQVEPWRTLIGASHGIELPFLFGNFGPSLYSVSFGERNLRGREQLSEALVASLDSFIRTGTPSLGTWERWSQARNGMVFDANERELRIRPGVLR